MKEEDIVLARVNLTTVTHSLHDNYVKTKTKNPNATEWLDIFSKLRDMNQQAYTVFTFLEKEYRASRQKNYDDERLVLELIAENKELKKLNEELKKGI